MVISIPEKKRNYAERIMSKLIFESELKDAVSECLMHVLFQELVLLIIRCQKYYSDINKEIDVDNLLIQEVATYIFENYDVDHILHSYSILRDGIYPVKIDDRLFRHQLTKLVLIF